MDRRERHPGAVRVPGVAVRAWWTALLVFALLGPPAAAQVPLFVRVVQPPTAAERALLEKYGVTGYLVRASDQPTLEALRGAPLLIEGLLPEGNLRLPAAEMDRYFESYFASRDPALTVRPSCFHREPVRGALRDAAATAAAALKPYAPIVLFLVDDPSLTVGSEPFDWCYCDACRSRWHEDLAARYAHVGELAQILATELEAFSDVPSWTVDVARARNLDRPRAQVNLFRWLAYRRFLDRAHAHELARLGELARTEGSAVTGFLGGAPSNPFGGHDWGALVQAAQVLAPADDPTSRWVARSLGPASALFTTLRSTGGTERLARRKLLDQLLQGSAGVLIQSLADIVRERNGVLEASPLLVVTFALQRMLEARVLPALRHAQRAPAAVGILYSPTSLDVLWLKDTEADGVWWPSRTARRGRELLPLAGAWWGWQLACEDLGVDYRYLDEDGLARGAGLDGLRALVLPRAIALSDAAVQHVRKFVERGGLLLADSETALFDEHGRGRATGALDDLFGIERDDMHRPWDWHAEEERAGEFEPERVLGLRVREPAAAAGAPHTLVEREHGAGLAVYLNLDLGDYVTARTTHPEAAAELLAHLRVWLAHVGTDMPLRVASADGSPLSMVRVHRFTDHLGRELVALTRNDPLPELRGQPESADVRTYVVHFDRPRSVLDLLRRVPQPGTPTEIRIDLAPTDLAFFALR